MNKLYSLNELRGTFKKLSSIYKAKPHLFTGNLFSMQENLEEEERIIREFEDSAALAFEERDWEALVLVSKSVEKELKLLTSELSNLECR